MLELQHLSARNKVTYLIQQCKNVRQLKEIQTQIITSPNFLKNDLDFLISRLLYFTAIPDSGSLPYATRIFQHMKSPKPNLYNIMIRAYASKVTDAHLSPALILYKQMHSNGIAPDNLTFPFLVKECTKRLDIGTCVGIHGQAIKFGVYNNVFVQNSMISCYFVCGFVGSARKLFDEMPIKDAVSWNSMIIGYVRSGDLDKASDSFRKMEKRNVRTWNSIITGFVQGGRPKEALEFFQEMQCLNDDREATRPDKITIASVLSACAYLGAIDHGIWVHSYLERSGLEFDMVIGTALVDMYGKCGCLEKAYEVFKEMPRKDTLAWTAMISAFALHGHGKEAFDLFEEMEAEGVRPNQVTFIALLSACAHSGLVEKGRWCFHEMMYVHTIEPQVHHYACMVDVLGRAGLFDEAEELIRSMPMEPDVFVWGALLGGCQMHGNIQLGEIVAKRLIDLDPLNHAFYLNLCDVYSKASRFDEAKRIRSLMEERGIKKEVPGCSMVDVDGVVHEFSVRGSPDVVMEEIAWVSISLNNEMRIKVESRYVNDKPTEDFLMIY